MISSVYYNPTKIIFGKGTRLQAGQYVREYADRVLLHYGSRHAVESGLVGEIRSSLEQEGITVFELGGVVGNPRLSKVREGIEICRKNNINFILGVGGGSVIDSSKAISIGVRAGDGFFENYFVRQQLVKEVVPVATVLTLPGTGSESSNSVVITDEESGRKLGYNNDIIRPVFSILDPELTLSIPPYFTAAGVVDAMTHIMERYFTNTQGVDTGDRICEGLLKALIRNGRIAVREPENYDARAEIMWACKLAHDNTCGIGREQDWASHKIEHELSAMYDVSHGAGLAVIFPAWMKYVYKHDVMRFVQFAHRVFDVDIDFNDIDWTARRGIKAFMRFCEKLRMPVSLSALGIPDNIDTAELAEKCIANKGGKVGAFVPLDACDIEAILDSAK